MSNFKHYLCLVSLAGFATAAEISLTGDNKITGELVGIDENGSVSLTTSYSNDPLKLKADKLVGVYFGTPAEPVDIPEQNLTLINGDTFPCDIRGLDDKVLKISSPLLGQLDVPREIIDSLEVGMYAKKPLYSGPKDFNEWKNAKDEISTWGIEDKSLVSNGLGTIYRDMQLPDAYAVRFKVKWENQPNFRFYFGDPMDFSGNPSNRYFIQFGRAGMEFKRETRDHANGNRFPQIAVIDRKPEEFPNKEFMLEVRVNRNGGKLELYINDQLEGRRYVDRTPNFPNGKGIAFSAVAADENKLRISNLEIYEWEDRADRHRSEDRGDGKLDAIIGRNGERFSGRLVSITDGQNGKIYRFKSDFQEDPIDLPDTEVSSVFFLKSPNQPPKKAAGMSLALIDGASLQISKCILNNSALNVTHPLIGDIRLERSSIVRLQRANSPANQTKGK